MMLSNENQEPKLIHKEYLQKVLEIYQQRS